MSGVYSGPGNPTHGIVSTYRNTAYACRCRPCRDANAAFQRRGGEKRAARLAADPSIVEHGLLSTYLNWACRCDPCKAAHSARLVTAYESRKARLKADPTSRPHGTVATYQGWGCRCAECVAAMSDYNSARRAA